MLDEFEVVVDDGTCEEVAAKIWQSRDKVLQGDSAELEELTRQWTHIRGKPVVMAKVEQEEDAQDTDGEQSRSDNAEEANGAAEDDARMGEAPRLGNRQTEKPRPEVDEDGFTAVIRKKR